MKYFDAPLIPTYKPRELAMVSGKGCYLKDENGKEYLDCLAGIAVVSVGHANEYVNSEVKKQLDRLGHLSNIFWTEPMALLAKKIHETAGFGKVFFANSGAEANECAIKLARKFSSNKKILNPKILCAKKSFHGRTLASLAATGQPDKWKGFEPLGNSFIHLDFNNLKQFEDNVDESTIAIFVEPIQGEGGIIPGEIEFLKGLRKICDEKKLLLIFDEVQSGVARTGEWWAFQTYGITPDIFTSAKALGNGFPIGACVAKESVASCFSPGSHASTFGGGPIQSTAALATLEYVENYGLMKDIPQKEKLFKSLLSEIQGVKEVRGKGLMLACVLDDEKAKDAEQEAFNNGLIVNAVRSDAIRITPPLIISDEEIIKASEILKNSIEEVFKI